MIFLIGSCGLIIIKRKEGCYLGEQENKQGEPLISREDVWDVLQFSDALYKGYPWLYGGGVYTPEILNQNL